MAWDEAFARRYDEWSAHMREDVPFYVELARAADGPLVELAVGNGRVAISRATGNRPSSSSSCRTRPTSVACSGAAKACPASTSRALTRYYTAFEAGDLDTKRFEARVSALETRLDALREQDADLAEKLAPQATTSPDAADLAAVADNLENTIATAEPRQAKALLRLLIKDLRVNARSEILPTYRIVTPTVCALPSPVGAPGIEPGTSRV